MKVVNSKVCLLMVLAIFVVGSVFVGCAKPAPTPAPAPAPKPTPAPKPAPVPTPAPKPPEVIRLSTFEVGSQGYTQTAIVGDAILEKFGIKVRVLPAGSDVSRLLTVRTKDVDAALSGGAAFYAQDGLEEFSTIDWGPQPLRMLWMAKHPGAVVGVWADSDIYKATDLRGKKVPYLLGSPAGNSQMENYLVFAGLTWDDVEVVKFPSYGTSVKAFEEGAIDIVAYSPAGSSAYRAEASPHGLRYIPIPASNKEGWASIKKKRPDWTPIVATIGAGLSADKPLETATYPYPLVIAYDWTDEDIAYFITKSIHESYDIFAPKEKSLEAYWSPDVNLALFDGSHYPLHRGAIRYMKEIGVWTPEREAKNQDRIERQKKLREAWDSAVAEAEEKGLKAAELSPLWLEKRAAVK